ncbi:Transposase [Phytophthora megakarya]|uniref:Transposase n=1 Tax=Phytophthora megakarya TaxID=4795 RepID=A0A225WXA6_9STRA|nr:Transposase [Phytophthora megakarya]
MTYSIVLRWRDIVLMYVYSVDIATVATVLGVSVRSLSRWYTRFRATGNVLKDRQGPRPNGVDGTFTRVGFHDVFKERILPFLNSWPLPRSIVIMDNAKIHMYEKLQVLVHATGALLFFLLPYSPDLNSIEVGFLLLKRWIQRYANMAFREDPLAVLRVAMYECTKQKEEVAENLYSHCGYKPNESSIHP